MRKIFFSADRIACALLLLLCGSGCMKDKVTYTYQIQTPVYQTLTQARTAIKSIQPTDLQNPGKICVYKNYLFLNDAASNGIHVIDNTDPTNPRNIAFINMPGNTDLSVKDDVLYANESYGDLVAMDIEDPAHVIIKKFIPAVFQPSYGYMSNEVNTNQPNPDSILIITGWITKDTTVNYNPGNNLPVFASGGCPTCLSLSGAPFSANTGSYTGTNGSTSGFAILNNYLYAISSYNLNVVDISSAENPALANRLMVNDYYETIYPFQNKLFLGSGSGMYIYDITKPSAPVLQGAFAHVSSCDPVIADEQHAYVTLRSGTACQGFTNELDILDITNLGNPLLLKTYPLTNPRGLSKEGNLLFICDGNDGLKIYDATDINNLVLIKKIVGFEANDVIAMNGNALVIATDGLYQFDYSDTNNIHLISKL